MYRLPKHSLTIFLDKGFTVVSLLKDVKRGRITWLLNGHFTLAFISTISAIWLTIVSCMMYLREGPCENHANGSTMRLSDFPQIWHTRATSLVHIPCGTVWLNCLLFRRNVNQTVTSTNVLKFEAKFTPNLITSYKHNIGRNEMSYLLTVVLTLNKRTVYSKLLSVNSFV